MTKSCGWWSNAKSFIIRWLKRLVSSWGKAQKRRCFWKHVCKHLKYEGYLKKLKKEDPVGSGK